MHKFFKLTGVSMLAVMTTMGANAAGYTCEELVEYTSCNPGYRLVGMCPTGYVFAENICEHREMEAVVGYSEFDCQDNGAELDGVTGWYARGCIKADSATGSSGWYEDSEQTWRQQNLLTAMTCEECPAGSSCAGETLSAVPCSGGTYQPDTKQQSCLTTPAGAYSGKGATNYIYCSVGTYQPNAGQSSCKSCPAGSYCATTGLAEVSGLCADGTYSTGRADSCSSCPETNLTDLEGNPVMATTGGDGAKGVLECYIGSNTYFKDNKGIYHYKSECNAYGSFDEVNATEEEKVARCMELGGDWDGFYCWAYASHWQITDEEWCNQKGYYWEQSVEECMNCTMDFSGYDLNTGEFICHM